MIFSLENFFEGIYNLHSRMKKLIQYQTYPNSISRYIQCKKYKSKEKIQAFLITSMKPRKLFFFIWECPLERGGAKGVCHKRKKDIFKINL